MPAERLRKLTDENREIANNLMRESRPQQSKKQKKNAGSDLSSTRDSEERQFTPAFGRGGKRGRDNDIEKVRL